MSNSYFEDKPYFLSAIPRNKTREEKIMKMQPLTCRGEKFSEKPYHRPREVFPKYQCDNSQRSRRIKVRVTNLDQGVVADDMRELFAEFGPLKDVTIYYKSGKSLGFADVIFYRLKDAERAIEKYNNVFLDGMPMNIKIVSPLLPLPSLVKQQNYEYLTKENNTLMGHEKGEEFCVLSKPKNINTSYDNRQNNENFKKRINISLKHEENQINRSCNRKDKDILNHGKVHGHDKLSNTNMNHDGCYKQGMLSTSKYENSSVAVNSYDRMHDYENVATLPNSRVRQYREEGCESFTRSPYSIFNRSKRQSHQNFIRPTYSAIGHDREQTPRSYGSSSNSSTSHYEQLCFQNSAECPEYYNREKKRRLRLWNP